jgi:hypothetical protein
MGMTKGKAGMGTGENAQYMKKGGKAGAKKMMAGGTGYKKGGMTKSKKK